MPGQRPRSVRSLRYSQAQVVPLQGQDADYSWTFNKGDYDDSDITFTLEIQGTTDSAKKGTDLDWGSSIITKTLKSSGDDQYTVPSTNHYTYSLSDDDSIEQLEIGTYYWSRIQSIADSTLEGAWNYSADSFRVTGAIDNVADLVQIYDNYYLSDFRNPRFENFVLSFDS